jgi:hypothetical protein
VISQWLAYRAASIIAEDHEDDDMVQRTDAACIAVLSQLNLPSLSFQLLHDIALVANTYPHTSLHTLASNLIRSVLPGLQDSLVTGYIDALRNAQLADVHSMYRLAVYIQALSGMVDLGLNKAASFWPAVQQVYDNALPALLSKSMGAETNKDVAAIAGIAFHIRIKHIYMSMLAAHAASLPMQTWLDLLEAEGNAPDMPDTLASLPVTSLVNQTMLVDAQYQFHLSDKLVSAAPEAAYVSKILRSLIDEDDDIANGKDIVDVSRKKSRKGKGKAAAIQTKMPTDQPSGVSESTSSTGYDPAHSGLVISQELSIIAQVQAILPDTASEIISRLLKAPSLAGLENSGKVERLIQMVLEAATAEDSTAQAPIQQKTNTASPLPPSTFAARRANIFSDQIDLSKTNLGAQEADIMNDPFLPLSLKEAILQAAQNQHLEELEEEEAEAEERARFATAGAPAKQQQRLRGTVQDVDDDFSDMDRRGTVRVKDNIDEESDAEEEEERMQAAAVPTSGSNAAGHLSAEIESLLLSSYLKDPSVFATSARRSAPRASLKKQGNAGLSDEQIEGWARMLERNPRKDKILAAATEFRGNQKGMDVRPGKPGQQQKQLATPAASKGGNSGATAVQADNSNGKEAGDSKEGAGGGRGRGGGRGASKGNRGHQGDQRRRGHDKKMAKTGA